MGRYANFSSGFQYKFAVAVQDSSNIEEFDGEYTKKGGTMDICEDEDNFDTITWLPDQSSDVLRLANAVSDKMHITDSELNQYTSEYALWDALDEKFNDENEVHRAKFILGALIAYQLFQLADDEFLSVVWEG
jgi:hypothetical protein